MIFRTKNGKLVEVKRTNFVTDKKYYEYIMNIL